MSAPETQTTSVERKQQEAKIERVAVVFAHGQGEQVPMQDVVELTKSVWLAAPETQGLDPEDLGVWSVPVFDADISEQRRLVTTRLKQPGGKTLQVDFYQFYWADLMTGNRFLHLWSWVLALMMRKKPEKPGDELGFQPDKFKLRNEVIGDETPEPLKPLRRILMWVALGIGVLGFAYTVVTMLRLATVERVTWANFYVLLAVIALGFQIAWLTARKWRARAFLLGLGLIVASLTLGFFSTDLVAGRPLLIDAADRCVRAGLAPLEALWIWGGGAGSWPPSAAAAVALAHSAISALLVAAAALFGWLGYNLYQSFLTRVMADSARMLSPVPENLPAQDRIRKRGMELLEALHASERRYDRIVWVAHSLGAIVSYGVLAQYWGNVYRLFDHGPSTPQREAVEAAARALNDAPKAQWPPLRDTYRKAVRDYHKALKAQESELPETSDTWRTAEYTSTNQLLRMLLAGVRRLKPGRRKPEAHDYRCAWLISDFVTLGSPLTYASLLMATSDSEFCEQIETRRYPTCPPKMKNRTTFSYDKAPNHAALFATTCWTNLFFETTGLVKGDIIGGKVAGDPPHGLGRGILDVAVVREEGMPKFAHNEYWKMPDRDDAEANPAEHVKALRAAINLFGEPPDRVDQTLNLLAPPRTKPKA
jgi:hypothetical protein